MSDWTLIDRAMTPDGTELTLFELRGEFLICANGRDLMCSNIYSSEQELARIAIRSSDDRVMVGGLGMGWTLRAALDELSENGRVTLVELVPEVVRWNEGEMGALSGHPLYDSRVDLRVGDVGVELFASVGEWDAVLLDVDNGPEAFTQGRNNQLYTPMGLQRARMALKPGGRLAVWSAFHDPTFPQRLRRAGFEPEVFHVRADRGRGDNHVIYIGENRY